MVAAHCSDASAIAEPGNDGKPSTNKFDRSLKMGAEAANGSHATTQEELVCGMFDPGRRLVVCLVTK